MSQAILKACVSAALAAMLVTAPPASSEPAPWMRKDRPNELALSLSIHSGCPLSEEIIERRILRTFDRSWMVRVSVMPDEIYLAVELWCRRTEDRYQYSIRAEFMQYAPGEPASGMNEGYDDSGIGGVDTILERVDANVQAALDDHIYANFAL